MRAPADARPEPRFLYRDAVDLDTEVGRRINSDFLGDEETIVRRLADEARLSAADQARVRASAARLVESVRRERAAKSGLDAFLRKYDLSSQEGVILMCLAEALLRIPDDDTADRLIADKIRAGDWESHLGDSESLFVNASTWGLLLTGRMVSLDDSERGTPGGFVSRLVTRMGEPMVRGAMRQAMRIMGHQFVMGRTIDEALERSLRGENARYRYSFDMLGEAALTAPDAERYLSAYRAAIETVGRAIPAGTAVEAAASISVKLSALHPRYERSNRGSVLDELGPRLVELGRAARDAGVALTVDAEESERLELSLELVEAVCRAPELERLARLRSRRPGVSEARCGRDRLAGGRSPRGRAVGSTCGSSRAPTGTARSSARRSAASTLTRSTRANATPTSPISRSRAGCCAPVSGSTRSSRRTTRTPWPTSRSSAASSIAASSSSGCTAWARSFTRRSWDAKGSIGRVASMPRSASMRTCCRTSYAGCSRTAPTRRSSTAYSTSGCPPR